MLLTISTFDDLSKYRVLIERAALRAIAAIPNTASPIETFKRMKFEQSGFHPIEDRSLNLIEQINQTFTYLVALRATAWLLDRHPDAGGFRLAPGADALLPLDIMSNEPDLVGAETFAAVKTSNNQKLTKDLQKLQRSPCRFRYAFFCAPGIPAGRIERLERCAGVEVHCVEV